MSEVGDSRTFDEVQRLLRVFNQNHPLPPPSIPGVTTTIRASDLILRRVSEYTVIFADGVLDHTKMKKNITSYNEEEQRWNNCLPVDYAYDRTVAIRTSRRLQIDVSSSLTINSSGKVNFRADAGFDYIITGSAGIDRELLNSVTEEKRTNRTESVEKDEVKTDTIKVTIPPMTSLHIVTKVFSGNISVPFNGDVVIDAILEYDLVRPNDGALLRFNIRFSELAPDISYRKSTFTGNIYSESYERHEITTSLKALQEDDCK